MRLAHLLTIFAIFSCLFEITKANEFRSSPTATTCQEQCQRIFNQCRLFNSKHMNSAYSIEQGAPKLIVQELIVPKLMAPKLIARPDPCTPVKNECNAKCNLRIQKSLIEWRKALKQSENLKRRLLFFSKGCLWGWKINLQYKNYGFMCDDTYLLLFYYYFG